MKTSNLFGGTSKVYTSEKSSANNPAYGIDLGTTNSCISVLGNSDIPSVIQLDNGKFTMPSCVLWDSNKDTFIIGEEAYKKRHLNNACYSVKRLMGTDSIITFTHGNKRITKTPVEVSAMILEGLVKKASTQYKNIKDVVITVPAEFNNRQVKATMEAAKLANLNVLNIMREPTAASLVYKLDSKPGNILVYDLGGGTFDVSVVSIRKSVSTESSDLFDALGLDTEEQEDKDIISVIATRGNTALGGDDLDKLMLDLVLRRLKASGVNVEDMPNIYKEQLLLRLESLKKTEGFLGIEMPIEYISTRGTKVNTTVEFSYDDYQNATRKLFNVTKKYVDDIINSGIKLDCIVLVGGSTKNINIKNLLKETYNLPCYDHLNPDESVSLGAAIQAKRLKFGSDNLDIFDVTANAIGILADQKVMKLIEKNKSIPYSTTRTFATVIDNQECLDIEVYEGSSIYPDRCTYLGNLIIDNIPKGPKGTVGVHVTLSIDNNGVLYCSTRVGNTEKKVELVNILGRAKSENASKNSVMFDRWYAFANSVENEKDRETLLSLIDEARQTPHAVGKVVSFMRSLNENTKKDRSRFLSKTDLAMQASNDGE